MNTLEAIKKRKSVRSFKNTPVTDEQIRLLLEAGMAAPSGVNKQPWVFYVIKDKEANEKFLANLNRGKYDAPLIIVACADLKQTLEGDWGSLAYCDLGAVTQNILLEATELGLGSVWCAGWPLQDRMVAVRKALSLPESIVPFSILYIGYENGYVEPKEKFDESKIHII